MTILTKSWLCQLPTNNMNQTFTEWMAWLFPFCFILPSSSSRTGTIMDHLLRQEEIWYEPTMVSISVSLQGREPTRCGMFLSCFEMTLYKILLIIVRIGSPCRGCRFGFEMLSHLIIYSKYSLRLKRLV